MPASLSEDHQPTGSDLRTTHSNIKSLSTVEGSTYTMFEDSGSQCERPVESSTFYDSVFVAKAGRIECVWEKQDRAESGRESGSWRTYPTYQGGLDVECRQVGAVVQDSKRGGRIQGSGLPMRCLTPNLHVRMDRAVMLMSRYV